MMNRLIEWVKGLFSRTDAEAQSLREELAEALMTVQALQEHEGRFEKLLREATRPFAQEDAGEALPWTASEVAAWRQFLRSPTGQLMLRQAGHLEQRANANACRRTDPDANVFANNAGYARGWSDATDYFFRSLTVDVPPAAQRSSEEDEATESAKGAADIRERLAP